MPELVPAEPLTPEWHAARRGGVTATDIVTILGLSTRDSVYSLFWRKMNQVPDEPDNGRFRLGRELEPYIVGRWGQAHPDAAYALQSSLWRSSTRPWQMATLDAEVYDGEAKVTTWGVEIEPASIIAVLEVKTWADADRHSWGNVIEGGTEAPPSENARSWQMDVVTAQEAEAARSPKPGARPGPATPKIPPAVRAQVLWQMDTMDVATGHVGVVFLPSGEFRSYVIEHHGEREGYLQLHPDCSICDDQVLMREAGEEFMARLRLELPPPDPDSSAATLAAQRARFTRQPDKQADVDRNLWEAWRDECKLLDEAEAAKRMFEIQLREQAGEASVLCVDGQPVARRVIVDAQVRAHVRHQDYLKRIKQGDDSDNSA